MKKWILVVPFILATTCLAQALGLGDIDAALERANTQAKVTYEKSTVFLPLILKVPKSGPLLIIIL